MGENKYEVQHRKERGRRGVEKAGEGEERRYPGQKKEASPSSAHLHVDIGEVPLLPEQPPSLLQLSSTWIKQQVSTEDK